MSPLWPWLSPYIAPQPYILSIRDLSMYTAEILNPFGFEPELVTLQLPLIILHLYRNVFL